MPIPGPLLKHYIQVRWRCLAHGWFETGTLIFQHAVHCPACGIPAEYVEHCNGLTARELPYVTKPHGQFDGPTEQELRQPKKAIRPAVPRQFSEE